MYKHEFNFIIISISLQIKDSFTRLNKGLTKP